jgi:hypothetical protein
MKRKEKNKLVYEAQTQIHKQDTQTLTQGQHRL